MLQVYKPTGTSLERVTAAADNPALKDAAWFDLVSPTLAEDKLVEQTLGLVIPTREEMQEIEVSSRLYEENGVRYMTATLMCQSETATPKITPVTFILAGSRLVTVRYDDPRPFPIVVARLARACPAQATGATVLLELLEAVIDRTADILEKISGEVERVSTSIFEPVGTAKKTASYKDILISIGRQGDLTSKARESLVSIGRLVLFLANASDSLHWPKETRVQLKSMQRDVQSLSDHATYLANKITFLLDAMLGVVSLEQNNIIKIFSVAAVVLMPPTLVASIYGMNFQHMPELGWQYGYPVALAMMVVAAILPYRFFKWKGWL